MADKTQCDKTHVTVRPRDFLDPSPVNVSFYVFIVFVLVCLCRFSGRFFFLHELQVSYTL